MYRRSPLRSTMNTNVAKALGMCKACTEAVHSVARKRQDWTCESTKTRKREESTCEHENAKTRKPENGENAKTPKTRKRENGENPKTRKRRKPENGENAFASSNMLLSIKLAIKDARRWEQRETRKRENGQKRSRFLVFSFRWPHPSGQVAFFSA